MTTIDPAVEPGGEGELFTPCPGCAFGNPVGERTCLFCAAPLPFFDATRRVSRRLVEEAVAAPAPPALSASQGSGADRQAAPSSRLPRVAPAAPRPLLALLCCRPLPPLPLGPVALITIGRSPDCHVVLPHAEVSRHHCSIKVRRQHLVIEDEGSSNGTLVNERRVASADLKVGDVVTIGPYVLEVLDEERATAWEAEDDATGAVDVSHAMTGRLDEMPLAEVLQQLEFNERTGTLQVASGRRRGQLVLDAGRPLSAAFQRLRDGKAVLAMLALEEGRFSFVRTPGVGPRRMDGVTLTALLLERSRRVDEGRDALSASDWDLQGEGGEQARALGTVGPAPRAPRLSPAMRPTSPPAALTPTPEAASAADTIVPDAADTSEVPEPYTSRALIAAPGADTVVLAPGALDLVTDDEAELQADGQAGVSDVPRRPVVHADSLRARSDRLASQPAPASAPPAAPAVSTAAVAPLMTGGPSVQRLAWGLVAALALTCALLLARGRGAASASGDDLRARAAALTRDVDQALTSPRSLVADGPALAGLRGRLTALRALDAPEQALAAADARLALLDGLAAAARGDAGAVSAALGRSSGADVSDAAASALLGAASAVGLAGGQADARLAVEHLSRAIDGGVIRPELRAWRARLRGRAPLLDVGTAAAVLDDLRVVAAATGLSPDDELLRARALLVLGRDAEAAPALEALRERHQDAAREVALARVEQALARGDVSLAARRVVDAGFGAPGDAPPAADDPLSAQARAMAARVRRLAEPLLGDLRLGRSISGSSQTRLLDLLRLARLLGGAPLDDAATAPLLAALDRPGDPLPVELCLGLAELAGRDSEAARRQVLRRLYVAMERPDDAARGAANLTLLICFVVGAEPRGVARPADLLLRIRDGHVRAELYHARALAREQLGRLRDAVLDARRALAIEPEREDLQALRARLTAALRAAPPPAPPPPEPRRRRRVG